MCSTVDLTKAWPSMKDRAWLAGALKFAGMPAADVAPWLNAKTTLPLEAHAVEIFRFVTRLRQHARGWFDTPLLPEDALEWHEAGFTPDEACAIQRRAFEAAAAAKSDADLVFESDWRALDAPPAWIIACLDSGVTNPTAVAALLKVARDVA
ncbi:hypothetical protein H5V45_09260 [Nocardioides sp. KIGAM211]|uniref:Uncharacterized protein n=1 Tax=Nocardioides luti TaxID=2761101 RepID=A0A7X0VAN0_9ACTN|nr:hypothetical protein [Nocardioides luti]MBB6627510.1 hypothetical protein [Nocardioides luti]